MLNLRGQEINCDLDHLDDDHIELVSDDAILDSKDTECIAEVKIKFKYGNAELLLRISGEIVEIEPLESGQVHFNIKMKSRPSALDNFFAQIDEVQEEIHEFMRLAQGLDY